MTRSQRGGVMLHAASSVLSAPFFPRFANLVQQALNSFWCSHIVVAPEFS